MPLTRAFTRGPSAWCVLVPPCVAVLGCKMVAVAPCNPSRTDALQPAVARRYSPPAQVPAGRVSQADFLALRVALEEADPATVSGERVVARRAALVVEGLGAPTRRILRLPLTTFTSRLPPTALT